MMAAAGAEMRLPSHILCGMVMNSSREPGSLSSTPAGDLKGGPCPGNPAAQSDRDLRGAEPSTWPLRAGLAALILLHWFAPRTPPDGVWGVVGVLSLSPWLRHLALALCSVLLVPAVARAALGLIRRIRHQSTLQLGGVPVAVWIVLLVTVGWLFRCQIPYGDADGIPNLIQGGQWINHKEPLDRLLVSFVYRLGFHLIKWDAVTAVAIVNTAVSGLFWLGLWRFVWRRGTLHPLPSLVAAGLLASTGVTQLLFGYVESYTLLTVGCLWTLFGSLEAVQDSRRPIWPVALAFGLTFSCHLAAAWMAPALVVVWASRHRCAFARSMSRAHLRVAALREALVGFFVASAPIVFLAAVMLLGGVGLGDFSFAHFGGGDGVMFVPLRVLSTPFEVYTMFSAAHLAAFFNQILLIGPVGVVLALFACSSSSCPPNTGDRVLLAASVGPVVYAFVFNPDLMVYFPELGPMTEWDLLSLPALPLTFLGVWRLRALYLRGDKGSEVALPAVLLSAFHCITWLLFNARIHL